MGIHLIQEQHLYLVTHLIVNHSLGFINENGDHTNQVENMWSHLKQDYHKRVEINHERLYLA
jgi:hypothetical protein